MRREFAAALSVFLTAALATAQQPDTPTPRPAITQSANVTVHYAGPGVTAPELLSSSILIYSPRHCNHYDGIANLSAVVDDNGLPRNINFQSGDPRLANVAIGILTEERFKPGTYNGAQAATAVAATIGMQTCMLPIKNADPGESDEYTLRSHPPIAIEILAPPSPPHETANSAPANSTEPSPDNSSGPYEVGGSISAPYVIHSVMAQYTDDARQANYEGICVVSLIVNAQGDPVNVRAVRPIGMGLDQKAIEAVRQYKFKPAMKDGKTPVPVMVTIEVDFRLK
jgi:TonB family protein